MAKAEKQELQQTYSSFTLKGIVGGLNKQNAFRTGEVKKGKNKGKGTQSVAFQVQTSKVNNVRVELFGMEPEHVYISKDEKVQKGQKRETKKLEYAKRNKIPEGWSLIGIQTGLEKDDNGKNILKTFCDYDAAEYIYENLEDGQSIYVNGVIQHSEYEAQDGTMKKQTKFIVKKIYLENKPIDFDADGFEEVAVFEEEIIFVDSDVDRKEGIVVVSAYVVDYKKDFELAQFVIRPEGNEKIEKTANAFAKKVKFGSFIKVAGNVINKVETEEVEEEDDNPFGGERPVGLPGGMKTFLSELRITYADNSTYEPEKYSEDDFVKEELVQEEQIFGDKDSAEDITDDDLPF
jgi:hypothetical protein